jgi:hypothetical protein
VALHIIGSHPHARILRDPRAQWIAVTLLGII